MITVWKYAIINDSTLMLPKGAQVLSVNFKNTDLFIFCLIDTDQRETESRRFLTFKTNDAIPSLTNLKFIGTTSIVKQMMFFHTFEMLQ